MSYPVNERGEMDLTLREYAASNVWPCCGEAICKCGKARHPREIREMIREAAMEDLLLPECV